VVGVDPARVHAMPAADEVHPDLEAAAAAYAEELRRHQDGDFDLVLLGLGPDGHVASLFPGFPQLEVTDELAVAVTDSPKPPPERISLTFPALSRTREVWFLVTGDGKADAVRRALADEGSVQETPARGVTCENSTWWLDEAAASAL
jgi:6-phosphogluconolactonase